MWLFAGIRKYLYAAAVFIVAIALAYLKGVSVAKERQRIKDLERYKKTREKIDEAPLYIEPNDASEFLLDRIRRRNLSGDGEDN